MQHEKWNMENEEVPIGDDSMVARASARGRKAGLNILPSPR
jgi:hypothetical protein